MIFHKNKKLTFILVTAIVLLIFYFLAGNKSLKKIIPNEIKNIIYKYVFPYKFISDQDKIIFELKKEQTDLENKLFKLSLHKELNFKESQTDIKIRNSDDINLSNNFVLKKYNILNGFSSAIDANEIPGGYIDFHQDNLLILSSRGILGYGKTSAKSEFYFKQIDNNLNDFLALKQLEKAPFFSFRDILVFDDKIFISYVEEKNENCVNTSVLKGKMNYGYIKFEKLFSPEECIHMTENVDNEFVGVQSGGRIINFDNNHIFFSLGEFRSRFLAQDYNSINGKIIKININNSNYEIISMGHRNPQGLYFDHDYNFLIETEHGPLGGDEINIINLNEVKKDKVLNFGWPIVSTGEHYQKNKEKYKKYPLYKSHGKYGFEEPKKSFVPSIAISEITKIKKNKYVVSSLKDKSLYFFELNEAQEIINLNRVEVFNRVRDLKMKDSKLYLFFEKEASIGIIRLN